MDEDQQDNLGYRVGMKMFVWKDTPWKNKMQHTNPNAHTYVNGTDVETHGYAVTQNTFLQ